MKNKKYSVLDVYCEGWKNLGEKRSLRACEEARRVSEFGDFTPNTEESMGVGAWFQVLILGTILGLLIANHYGFNIQ